MLRFVKKAEVVEALKKDYKSAPITPRQRALLDYADKLTREPGAMTEEDLAPLRKVGLNDRGILDLNQAVAYFAYVNRVADGLGVVVDDYAIDSGLE